MLKARGWQRTDATYVLASIRALNRLELVAETLQAALNEVATLTTTVDQVEALLPWKIELGKLCCK